MTSREIVQATLDYDGPERVARSFAESDIVGVSYSIQTRETDWVEVGGGRWERLDEWGNTWARLDPTSKGEVVKGILDSLADVERLEFPDFSDPRSYDTVPETRKTHPDKYIVGNLPGFSFNIARRLRKLENYLADLLEAPECLSILHDRIDALLENMIRNYAAAGADAVMFCEDWGTQSGLMIHPSLWQTEFMPRFAKLCRLAHDCGIRVWMHSCGQIEPIVPWLMDAGIAVLQFDQPELHGLDALTAHQERGKITFWCPVDIQRVLPQRNETRIRAYARAMLDKLWKGRGGFIAGYYTDNASLGLDPIWQEFACDEFLKHGLRTDYPS